MKFGFMIASAIAAMSIFAGTASAGKYCHHHLPPPVVVPHGEGIFVCAPGSTAPEVVSKQDATVLVANGSVVEAQAVAGNVEGGNNVGAYHLVCNAPGANTGTSVGDNGNVYGTDYGPQNEELGFYHIYA